MIDVHLREDEVATPDCGVGRETSKDLEDFRSDDLRAVARACLARDCDATHVLRVLDQRWTAVDNALERPFAKRVRAATEPVQYVSKFGETVVTQKDKEGADEFTHGREFAEFMKLEVGDMTPRETGANKWAYDPRYNRGLRLPDGIYNTKPRRTRPPAMAPRGLAAKKASANKTAAAPAKPTAAAPAAPAPVMASDPRQRSCPRRLWRPRRRRWTRSDEERTNFLPLARAQKSFLHG